MCRKNIVHIGFSTTHGTRHPLGALEHSPLDNRGWLYSTCKVQFHSCFLFALLNAKSKTDIFLLMQNASFTQEISIQDLCWGSIITLNEKRYREEKPYYAYFTNLLFWDLGNKHREWPKANMSYWMPLEAQSSPKKRKKAGHLQVKITSGRGKKGKSFHFFSLHFGLGGSGYSLLPTKVLWALWW